jgi:hypothetical protein
MSTLKIIKLESGAFKHNDSVDGDFFLGRFSFKQELNKAFLVEAYGAKRREYTIEQIEVFDYLGTVETFTNFTDLENRLVELAYTGIDTNLIPFTLTPTNFGSFSNTLTTEDAIPDAGVFNYTNILGLQVKTTWANIKAKLKTYFDAFYQVILVSGTNIKTINGTSILGSGNLVVSGGGGGDEFLLDTFTFPAQRYNTINVWKSPFPSYQAIDSDYLQSYGSSTTPNSNFSIQGQWLSVPDGYIIDKIELNINYKLEGSISSTLQVYVLKSEVNYSYTGSSVFNEQVLVNESVTLNAGSSFIKYSKNLTVASNSLPTLNKMHLRFAVRETQATDVYYSLNFKVKFKKV